MSVGSSISEILAKTGDVARVVRSEVEKDVARCLEGEQERARGEERQEAEGFHGPGLSGPATRRAM